MYMFGTKKITYTLYMKYMNSRIIAKTKYIYLRFYDFTYHFVKHYDDVNVHVADIFSVTMEEVELQVYLSLAFYDVEGYCCFPSQMKNSHPKVYP